MLRLIITNIQGICFYSNRVLFFFFIFCSIFQLWSWVKRRKHLFIKLLKHTQFTNILLVNNIRREMMLKHWWWWESVPPRVYSVKCRLSHRDNWWLAKEVPSKWQQRHFRLTRPDLVNLDLKSCGYHKVNFAACCIRQVAKITIRYSQDFKSRFAMRPLGPGLRLTEPPLARTQFHMVLAGPDMRWRANSAVRPDLVINQAISWQNQFHGRSGVELRLTIHNFQVQVTESYVHYGIGHSYLIDAKILFVSFIV